MQSEAKIDQHLHEPTTTRQNLVPPLLPQMREVAFPGGHTYFAVSQTMPDYF
jgi:hypothetical protein